jgi:hypothetical protein
MDGLQTPKAQPHGCGRSHESESLAYLGDDRHKLCGGEIANVGQPVTGPRKRQHAIPKLGIHLGTQWGASGCVAAGEAQHDASHPGCERDLDRTYRGVHDARLHAAILQATLRSRDTPSTMLFAVGDRSPRRFERRWGLELRVGGRLNQPTISGHFLSRI